VAELADAIAEHLREAGARHLTLGRDAGSPRRASTRS